MFWKAVDLGNGWVLLDTIGIILGPFLGAGLAGVFFEKAYKKIFVDWKEKNEVE